MNYLQKDIGLLLDFENLAPPEKPNYCIVAPGVIGKRCFAPVVYDMAIEQLKARWQKMIKNQPRIEKLHEQGQQIQYQQTSALFKFRDIITVQFNAVSATQSSIYLYSYSVQGYWDFGVNCRRVSTWLKQL